MKVSEQCRIAASKGNQIVGLIMRNITFQKKTLIIHLHKAIVRPHLEYCIQAWRTYRKKDIDTLERNQKRATKIIAELRDLSYEERLKECGLTTLERRRLRGAKIEFIDGNIFSHLRKKVFAKDQCIRDIRKHAVSQRKINEWNELSTYCVTASSVSTSGGRFTQR